MKIIFGSISIIQMELWLLYKKTIKDFAFLTFYIDDIFGAFETYRS